MAKEVVKKPEGRPSLKWQRDKDREMVKGIFEFHEVRGGTQSFVFKKYKEDPVERYDFEDGKIYTIPLGVAKHINNNCWYPEHHYTTDENGKPIARIGKKIRRCTFRSLEFMDIDDLNPGPDLVTVENVTV